jgi:hypothetical protein
MGGWWRSIQQQEEAITGRSAGLRVVEILQAASQSMAQHGGRRIYL